MASKNFASFAVFVLAILVGAGLLFGLVLTGSLAYDFFKQRQEPTPDIIVPPVTPEPPAIADVEAAMMPAETVPPDAEDTLIVAGADVLPYDAIIQVIEPDFAAWEVTGWRISEESVDSSQPLPEQKVLYLDANSSGAYVGSAEVGTLYPTEGGAAITLWLFHEDGEIEIRNYP